MFEIVTRNPQEIKVATRSRELFGDLNELDADIQKVGMLNPILIDENNTLLAGERRLRVYLKNQEKPPKDLEIPINWSLITCRLMTGLSKEDMIFIEWIENKRENFKWFEEIGLKLRLHVLWSSQANSWGYRDTAERLKVSLGGLSSDLFLGAALKQFPELKNCDTKRKARGIYQKVQNSAEAAVAIQSLPKDEQARLKEMMDGSAELAAADPVGSLKADADSQHLDDLMLEQDLTPEDLKDPAVLEALKAQLAKLTPEDAGADSDDETIINTVESKLPAFTYEVCKFQELLPKLPNKSVGLVEMDPPYAIGFEDVYGKTQGIKSSEKDYTVKELFAEMEFFFDKIREKLLDKTWIVLWCGHEHTEPLKALAVKYGFTTQKACIWKKPSGHSNTPSTTAVSNYETYLLLRWGDARFNTPSLNACIDSDTVPAGQRDHQWEKHKDVYRQIFRAVAKPGALFFSTHAGSGNAMIIASVYGMTPIGCDIQKQHCFSFVKKFKAYHTEE